MDAIERLIAAEEIRNLKAQYCRGIDQKDAALFASVFTRDATADYSNGLIDPNSHKGVDQKSIGAPHAPLRGGDKIADAVMSAIAKQVTVHHCATGEIHVVSANAARATWPMVDRLLFPPGSPAKEVIGYGFYDETYMREDGVWKIATVKLKRTRVDTIPF